MIRVCERRRRMRSGRSIRGVALLLGLGVLGCTGIGGTTPPSRFYLLNALEAPPVEPDGPGLGVGPVRLAEYLDRPQIVTRRSANALDLAEYDRWAEPLAASVTRVVVANLGAALRTDRVQEHPFRDARSVDVQVELDVQRFDGPTAGPVELVVHWRVRRGQAVVQRVSRLSEPIVGSGHEALAAAMSRALQRLCREIAAAVPSA